MNEVDMKRLWPLVSSHPLPRIHLLSDVHLETGPYSIPEDLKYDILIAAGDIGPVEQAVDWLASLGKPVVYVLGNHEFWDRELDEVLPAAKARAKGTQVHVLERESVVLHGVRFLGTTLWSSFGEWSPRLVFESMRRMKDFRSTGARRWFEKPSNLAWFRQRERLLKVRPEDVQGEIDSGRFHPAIAYQLYRQSLAWLERELQKRRPEPRVVITHHAPSYDCLREFGLSDEILDPTIWPTWYDDERLARIGSYASDLDEVMRRYRSEPFLWTHGHLHHAMDLLVSGVRIVSNPRGYAIKPLTEADKRGFGLFGFPLSDEQIQHDQKLHQQNPYRGDAPGFKRRLIIDFEEGYRRPLQLRVDRVAPRLEAKVKAVREMLPFISGSRSVTARCVRRVFKTEVEEFRRLVQEFLDGSVKNTVSISLSQAPQPDTLPMVVPFDETPFKHRNSQYQRTLSEMEQWLDWVRNYPDSVHRRLLAWQQAAIAALTRLREQGIKASVYRPPIDALRHHQPFELWLHVKASEADCDRIGSDLQGEIDARSGPHRDLLVHVRHPGEVRRSQVLTLDELLKIQERVNH